MLLKLTWSVFHLYLAIWYFPFSLSSTRLHPVSNNFLNILFFITPKGHMWLDKDGGRLKKNVKAMVYRKLKQCSRWRPLTFETFVQWRRKVRQDWVKADMVEHESQDQSAPVGTFSFREAGKLHNIRFPGKGFLFYIYSLSFWGEQCHRLWFMAAVFAN